MTSKSDIKNNSTGEEWFNNFVKTRTNIPLLKNKLNSNGDKDDKDETKIITSLDTEKRPQLLTKRNIKLPLVVFLLINIKTKKNKNPPSGIPQIKSIVGISNMDVNEIEYYFNFTDNPYKQTHCYLWCVYCWVSGFKSINDARGFFYLSHYGIRGIPSRAIKMNILYKHYKKNDYPYLKINWTDSTKEDKIELLEKK